MSPANSVHAVTVTGPAIMLNGGKLISKLEQGANVPVQTKDAVAPLEVV